MAFAGIIIKVYFLPIHMTNITPTSSQNDEELMAQGFDNLNKSKKEIFDDLNKARFPEDRKDYNLHSDDGAHAGGYDIYDAETAEERKKRKEREKLDEENVLAEEEKKRLAEEQEKKRIKDIEDIERLFGNIWLKK